MNEFSDPSLTYNPISVVKKHFVVQIPLVPLFGPLDS